jgi:hypothetical protein
MTIDLDALMTQTVDSSMSTSMTPCPEGEWQAMLDDITEQSFQVITRDDGTEATIFKPNFIITDQAAISAVGRDRLAVPHRGIWLDFDDDGQLSTGKDKNVKLGQLREAVGQNKRKGWGFGKLSGAGPVVVLVRHRIPDANDPETKYAEVRRVSAIK